MADFRRLDEFTGRSDGRFAAGMADCLIRQDNLTDAIAPLDVAVQRSFATPAVLNNLAYCLIQSGRPGIPNQSGRLQEARQLLDRVIQADPQLQAAYINRAVAEWQRAVMKYGDIPEQAIHDLNEAVKIGPESWELQQLAAEVCAWSAQFDASRWRDEALRHMEQALALGAGIKLFQDSVSFSHLQQDPHFRQLIANPPKVVPAPRIVRVVDSLSDDFIE
jgi:tetratricopeptide (TPR) repeat protein